jgi:hypothetical protein
MSPDLRIKLRQACLLDTAEKRLLNKASRFHKIPFAGAEYQFD